MRTLQVWDSPDEIPLVKGPLVVSWDGYVQNEDILSLLCQIDENKVRFRLKYTNWIASLGNYQVDGKTIVDHLSLEHGFSMWWMSLLVEKSIWKSPAIIDALRIFALEEILLERKPKGLELVSDNDQFQNLLEAWLDLSNKMSGLYPVPQRIDLCCRNMNKKRPPYHY